MPSFRDQFDRLVFCSGLVAEVQHPDTGVGVDDILPILVTVAFWDGRRGKTAMRRRVQAAFRRLSAALLMVKHSEIVSMNWLAVDPVWLEGNGVYAMAESEGLPWFAPGVYWSQATGLHFLPDWHGDGFRYHPDDLIEGEDDEDDFSLIDEEDDEFDKTHNPDRWIEDDRDVVVGSDVALHGRGYEH